MKTPSVFIVILNWNGYSDTAECLETVKKICYENYVVVVVDNASTDGSPEKLKAQFPDIVLIENKKNLGFAAGMNIGINYALEQSAHYIFLLNNDTVVDRNIVAELVKAGEKMAQAGILGPKVYYYQAQNVIQCAGGKLDWRNGGVHIGDGITDDGRYDCAKEVAYIPGCGMIVKRAVFEKIGMLNEKFFMYYEDVDFCVRARKAGFSCCYIPSAMMWHKVGASINPSKRWRTELQFYYHTRNKLISTRNNYALYEYLWLVIKQVYIFTPICMMKLIVTDRKLLLPYIYGLCDGLRGVTPLRYMP